MRTYFPTTKILLIFIILNIILFGFSLIEKFSTFSRVSALETYGDLGAYWDNECTQRVTSIEWGVLQPGSNKNINLFIKNEGDNTICPTLSTENWSPSIAFEYLNLEWNCTGESINSGEKLQIMLTLTIPFVVDFTDFSFDKCKRI